MEQENGVPITEYEVKDIRDCFHELGLSDLRSSGCFLMWTNGKIWCKLDRVVVNHYWHQAGYNAQNFLSLVKECWDINIRGTEKYYFLKRLQALKRPLRMLNDLHYSHISTRAEKANSELLELQQLLHDSPLDNELQMKMVDKRAEANRLAESNRLFMTQIAKFKCLKECDRNSSFFHALMRSKINKNHISSIIMENGNQAQSISQVVEEFLRFYNQLLGVECSVDMVDRGDYCSVNLIMECLTKFTDSSGLASNCSKSNLFHVGVKDYDLDGMKHITGFNVGEFPFRYLGNPLAASWLNAMHYSPLVDRIAKLFAGWPGHTLSYAGKLELINSVIQGVECFWLAIFPIPNNVLDHVMKPLQDLSLGRKEEATCILEGDLFTQN
ncbi:uncharacterized protein LOC131160839 [Malania oleifera]|uniref:uncharacterized protein LOC131160839 n=1 Tax=Malania oleifera TaxID=397392 RepID=UPI0025AE68BC|nr:uncharacterized protein LOC131160839 [Malania oleifera]